MSYVGQWEGRLLAIIAESRKRGHILYFDDLPGLFQAGKSRDSDLTMGQLLKAQLEEKAPLILAETTPDQWRRLKEIDRGFTDHFQVFPVREPDDASTLRILIRVMQEIERERHCSFDPTALPMVIQLQRRFAPTRLFPGKAAEQLHQLASSLAGTLPEDKSITDRHALGHFQAKSGITNLFLDRETTITRTEILDFFKQRIAGQEAGVEAMIDAVSMAKAGLNDATRPLASLLFLGPTGVGKTECAKALAEFVFGTSERLLRLDMNEFTDYSAVERLIGSASRQRGQLTDAIIRQPYGVLLLDEVEKAHPNVFDLLLQVLGDGRLTDASGRTADFCNAIVILTSNLGARAARQQMGFGSETHEDVCVYVSAAEKFFRPEFFNRLNRVVPFQELTRDHIASMVERMARKALTRYGFRQRRMMLKVEPDVYERIIERGFDPQSGARALRRAVEEELVQPLASQLAANATGEMTSLRIELDDTRQPVLRSSTYTEAPRSALNVRPMTPHQAAELVDAGNVFLLRIEDRMSEIEGNSSDGDFAAKASYYALREQVNAIRILRDRLITTIERQLDKRREPTKPSPSGKNSTRLRIASEWTGILLPAISEAPDSAHFFRELITKATTIDWLPFAAENLVYRVNHLEFLLKGEEDETITLSPPSRLLTAYENTFTDAVIEDECITITGLRIRELLAHENGNRLICGHNGELGFHAIGGSDSQAVIRVYHINGTVLDMRTGIISSEPNRPLWEFINPLLSAAPEMKPFVEKEEL